MGLRTLKDDSGAFFYLPEVTQSSHVYTTSRPKVWGPIQRVLSPHLRHVDRHPPEFQTLCLQSYGGKTINDSSVDLTSLESPPGLHTCCCPHGAGTPA